MAESGSPSLIERLNTTWHRPALFIFLAIVIAHWAEHIAQAYQVYVLGWAMPRALGVLGLWFPWLIRSESLHYGYAVVMLAGLWFLRKGFHGRAYTWWMISFWIQMWHHFEHGLLFVQATTGHNFFGAAVPTSVGQLFIRRMELHLIYNTLVFIPMVVAMWKHRYPGKAEAGAARCSCAVHRDHALAASTA